MRTRMFGFVAAAALLMMMTQARPAHADFQLAIGTKWLPVNYTRAISTAGATGFDTFPVSGWQNTALNNYLGFYFLDGRIGAHLGLDIGYGALHGDSTAGTTTTNNDQSFTQFGFSLGGKFHFTKPRGGSVSPYLFADIFKYFASVSTSDTGISNARASFLAGMVSPVGFDLAIGAEYFFTPAFSVGAEIFGFKFAYSGSEITEGGVRQSANWKYFTMYTGISLNYRFRFAGAVSVRQVEEQDPRDESAPAPRRRAPRQEAPPAAESVD